MSMTDSDDYVKLADAFYDQKEKIADLERQLKEAKDDKDKCQEYGMSLQQQLAEAKARLDSELKHHENCDNKTEHVFQELQQQLQAAKDELITQHNNRLATNKEKNELIAQLRQERDKLQKQLDEGSSDVLDALATERDTLRAKLDAWEKGTSQYISLKLHQEDIDKQERTIDYLRAEVERLKELFQVTRRRMCERLGLNSGTAWNNIEENAINLVARVQELERALNAVIDYAPFGKEDYNIAKRALRAKE